MTLKKVGFSFVNRNGGVVNLHSKSGVHDAKDIQGICRDLKKIEEVEDVRRF